MLKRIITLFTLFALPLVIILAIAIGTALAGVICPLTDDAFISNLNSSNNYGELQYLCVRNKYGPNGYNRQELDALVGFDLSSLPNAAIIDSAQLNLYYYNWQGSNPVGRYLSAYRIEEEWDESSVTFNNQPNTSSEYPTVSPVNSEYGWMTWDVTRDIQEFVNGTIALYGWKIMDEEYWGQEDAPLSMFYSKEHGDLIPHLEVTYHLEQPPEPPQPVCGYIDRCSDNIGYDDNFFDQTISIRDGELIKYLPLAAEQQLAYLLNIEHSDGWGNITYYPKIEIFDPNTCDTIFTFIPFCIIGPDSSWSYGLAYDDNDSSFWYSRYTGSGDVITHTNKNGNFLAQFHISDYHTTGLAFDSRLNNLWAVTDKPSPMLLLYNTSAEQQLQMIGNPIPIPITSDNFHTAGLDYDESTGLLVLIGVVDDKPMQYFFKANSTLIGSQGAMLEPENVELIDMCPLDSTETPWGVACDPKDRISFIVGNSFSDETFPLDKYVYLPESDDLGSTDNHYSRKKPKLSEATTNNLYLPNNYPNPFNATTTITFTLPKETSVSLDIYDLLGRKVITLANGEYGAGKHNVVWDATDSPSGIYFYKLTIGNKTFTKRMTLLK